ncbi:MAG: class I SAM-dependent methyltransferase [Solirubrobacteraceae bacterium]
MSSTAAAELYGSGLLHATELRAVSEHGEELPLLLERYVGTADCDEADLLDRALAPVIDVGCGPGRHVLALSRRGVHTVGVDISPGAVELARRRGARVIEGSTFDRLPGAGSWGSALLLDGNIGIGGRPAGLLARIGALLRPGGTALVELEPPGTISETLRVRLESAAACSDFFPWARVGVDDVERLAASGGYALSECWCAGERWFAQLARTRAVARQPRAAA